MPNPKQVAVMRNVQVKPAEGSDAWKQGKRNTCMSAS